MLNNDTTTLTTIDFSQVNNAHSILKILTNPKTRFTINLLVNYKPPAPSNGKIRILNIPLKKVNGRYPNVVDASYGYQIRKDLLNRNLIIEEPPTDNGKKSYTINNTLIDKIAELSKRLIIDMGVIAPPKTPINEREQGLDISANEKAKKTVWVVSNDKRQRIINLLNACERMSVTDIHAKLEKEINQIIPQPVISQHLAQLHKENLVTYEKGGRTNYYSLNREAIETLLNFIFEITNGKSAFKEENELEKLPPNLSPLSPLK